jgi:beta-xylosidase
MSFFAVLLSFVALSSPSALLARDPSQPPNPATAPAEPPIRPTPPGTYTNPLGVDLADPDVLLHEGVYYLYATSITNLGYFVWTSRDLVHWQQQEEMALSRDHQSWGNSNFWAPDAIHYNGKFYLFYNCVGPVGRGRMSHRICAAVSDNPLGPFKEIRGPMLDIGRAVIDAHVFIDAADNNKPYMYYSLDHSENVQPNGRQASELYVVPLAADLLGTAGEPQFCFGASQLWEGKPKIEDTWNEAPFVFKHRDTYVMTYSARVFSDPLYAVGYATAKSPLGPWSKAEENPILKKTRRVSGPGHNSVIPSPDGKELFVVYHSHKELEGGHDRELNIDRLVIEDGADGGVKLKILGPTRTPQRLPSGAPVSSPTTRRPVAVGQ